MLTRYSGAATTREDILAWLFENAAGPAWLTPQQGLEALDCAGGSQVVIALIHGVTRAPAPRDSE